MLANSVGIEHKDGLSLMRYVLENKSLALVSIEILCLLVIVWDIVTNSLFSEYLCANMKCIQSHESVWL